MRRFGPLSPLYIGKLKSLLDEHGARYEVLVDSDAAVNKPDHTFRPYPVFEKHLEYLYIEIETKDLLLVKQELLNMGFSVGDGPDDPPELQEFICLECQRTSLQAGLCPVHQIPMIEWSQWLAAQKQQSSRRDRWLVWIFIFILSAVAIVSSLKKS